METCKTILEKSKKIVVKVGSNVLSDDEGHVNTAAMRDIVEQISTLKSMGKDIIIVSSGAGICGVGALNKWARRNDMNYKQALCAIGQVELMIEYKKLFNEHDTQVAQMLLTRGDFSKEHRNLNIRNALFTLIDEGVVPIVNENDSVSVEEIKIGDNDTLGALTACIWNADVLIMLSDINGVYDKNPKSNDDAKLIEVVDDVNTLENEISTDGTSEFGTGGIKTKIAAAKITKEYGIKALLVNGKKKNIIVDVLEGKEKGTAF